MTEWREEVDAALNKTLLQSDEKAMFKLPDMQRYAVIKAIAPVIDRLLKPKVEVK